LFERRLAKLAVQLCSPLSCDQGLDGPSQIKSVQQITIYVDAIFCCFQAGPEKRHQEKCSPDLPVGQIRGSVARFSVRSRLCRLTILLRFGAAEGTALPNSQQAVSAG
jgi:hypothetical protein